MFQIPCWFLRQLGASSAKLFDIVADQACADRHDRHNTGAQLLTAVEQVFNLIQRTDRRQDYDQQVLKEMVGLLVRSFFNYPPATPPKEKEAALISGKVRFNRFLDILAGNLLSGQSILNDFPAEQQQVLISTQPEHSASNEAALSTQVTAPANPPVLPPVAASTAPVIKADPPAALNRAPPDSKSPATIRSAPNLPKPTHPRKWGLFQ